MTPRLRLALIGLMAAPALVFAQTYPDKPITLIVPFPPGIVDANARLVASKASAILGQPIVVRNMAGAASASAPMRWPRRPRTATPSVW